MLGCMRKSVRLRGHSRVTCNVRYCLRTPSSLLLLLAKLTGSTRSFPLLARAEPAENASLAEPAEGARAAPTENASLAESSSAETNKNASVAAEFNENAPAEPAEGVPAEPSEIAPAENAETRAEAAEEEWAAVRG